MQDPEERRIEDESFYILSLVVFPFWHDAVGPWHFDDHQGRPSRDRPMGCSACRPVSELRVDNRFMVNHRGFYADQRHFACTPEMAAIRNVDQYAIDRLVH